MPRKVEMIGSVFYRLTVIEELAPDKRGEIKWRCKCECGKEIISLGGNLRSGGTKSCGCYNDNRIGDLNRQHGMSKTRMFKIWVGVRKRCNNPNVKSFHIYGGSGIRMCGRWEDFENFYEDMKEEYTDNLTLDRFPNKNGNYEPSNCRWATPKQQQNNRNNNHIIELNSISKTLSEWSSDSGTCQATIGWRLKKGWNIEEAIYGKSKLTESELNKYLIV